MYPQAIFSSGLYFGNKFENEYLFNTTPNPHYGTFPKDQVRGKILSISSIKIKMRKVEFFKTREDEIIYELKQMAMDTPCPICKIKASSNNEKTDIDISNIFCKKEINGPNQEDYGCGLLGRTRSYSAHCTMCNKDIGLIGSSEFIIPYFNNVYYIEEGSYYTTNDSELKKTIQNITMKNKNIFKS